MNEIKVIFGLGNPGVMYERTRHNVGFMFIDYVLSHVKVFDSFEKFNSEIFIVRFYGRKIYLVKPLTFMNLSGDAYSRFINVNGILPKETVVIYDDVDLPIGRIRIREKGSDGGHRGMKSIIESVGTENIPRIRIGIGRKDEKIVSLADFVLSKFSDEELKIIDKVLQKIYEAFKIILHRGLNFAMSEYNKLTIDGGE